MKNKIEKYIRILFVLIMIISQTGLLPVYAEANNKDNVKGLTVSISKNEVNIGDEVAVTVQGSKKMIKDVEIETDSSLKKYGMKNQVIQAKEQFTGLKKVGSLILRLSQHLLRVIM